MSCQTSTCPSQSTPAPMPMVGISQLGGDPLGDVGRDHLQHDREGTGLLQGEGVADDLVAGVPAALHAVATEPVLALRGEAEVRHDRDPRGDQPATCGTTGAPPSSLTACAPPSLRKRTEVSSACVGEDW